MCGKHSTAETDQECAQVCQISKVALHSEEEPKTERKEESESK